MFRGEKINVTEDRAVLHVALRAPEGAVDRGRRRERRAAGARGAAQDGRLLRAGALGRVERVTPASAIRNVVNIGIGGSDLGPQMAYDALQDFSRRDMTFRFVSNVDGTDFWECTHDLDPEETLFIVASKTFTTLETLTNAHSAREWLLAALGDESRGRQALRRGVDERASRSPSSGSTPRTCSSSGTGSAAATRTTRAIGLSLMVAIGHEQFGEMLAGFHSIDEHFRTAPFEQNLPVLLGLIGIWYDDFFGAETQAILPYSQYLDALPGVPPAARHGERRQVGRPRRRAGHDADRARSCGASPAPTASTPSTNSSTRARSSSRPTSSASCTPNHEVGDHQNLLMANFLAQTEALAFGKTRDEVEAEGVPAHQVPHRTFRGQPPDEHDPGREAHAVHARPARRDLRAQGVHAGHDLEHQLVRPVGRRAGQEARRRGSSRSSTRPTRARRSHHDSSTERADPPLPHAAPLATHGQHRQLSSVAGPVECT